jgi:hypothetical protein
VDGSPDLRTQYDFESFPAKVWVGTAAHTPAEVISDEWKQHFFGSLDNALSAPDADPDGDGVSNLQEYKAGKQPTARRSAVRRISPWPGRNTSRLPACSTSACSWATWYSVQIRRLTGGGGSLSGRSETTVPIPSARNCAKVSATSGGCSPRASLL